MILRPAVAACALLAAPALAQQASTAEIDCMWMEPDGRAGAGGAKPGRDRKRWD